MTLAETDDISITAKYIFICQIDITRATNTANVLLPYPAVSYSVHVDVNTTAAFFRVVQCVLPTFLLWTPNKSEIVTGL